MISFSLNALPTILRLILFALSAFFLGSGKIHKRFNAGLYNSKITKKAKFLYTIIIFISAKLLFLILIQ